jgi:hypothetical protein
VFKGYRKEVIQKPGRGRRQTIEQKRQLVIDRIDAWLAVIDGAPKKGVQRLSKIEGDRRLVWLKYGHQNVPLTETGDLVGEIEAAQDEAGFWHWIRERVRAGDYDAGIKQIAESTYRRMATITDAGDVLLPYGPPTTRTNYRSA